MREITLEEQNALWAELEKIKPILEKYISIKDIGIGYAVTNGKITDKLSIIVYIDRKRPVDFLQTNEIIPKSINGLNIDIMEYNPIHEVDPYSRIDQLIGGINIGNANLKGGGTLGGIFKDKATNKLVGLTNWHVIKNKKGKVNDPIVQPAWTEDSSKYTIGKLSAWDLGLDCAVFTIETRSINPNQGINDFEGRINAIVQPLIGMKVKKSGARSGVTFGEIQSIKTSGIVIIPNTDRPQRSDREISISGDSGAIWFRDDVNLNAVALHWGGEKNDFIAYANNLIEVASKLNFEVHQ